MERDLHGVRMPRSERDEVKNGIGCAEENLGVIFFLYHKVSMDAGSRARTRAVSDTLAVAARETGFLYDGGRVFEVFHRNNKAAGLENDVSQNI